MVKLPIQVLTRLILLLTLLMILLIQNYNSVTYNTAKKYTPYNTVRSLMLQTTPMLTLLTVQYDNSCCLQYQDLNYLHCNTITKTTCNMTRLLCATCNFYTFGVTHACNSLQVVIDCITIASIFSNSR